MHIDLHAPTSAHADALRDHVARRLRYAMGWAMHQVARVQVALEDAGGPLRREGAHRCTMRARLSSGLELEVSDTQSDLAVAINRAAERLGRSVARQVRRQRFAEGAPASRLGAEPWRAPDPEQMRV